MADDYLATTATTGRAFVNYSVAGNIEASSDQDWFKITLLGGHNYVINERGAATFGGTLSDTFLTLYSSAGTQLTSNDDGGFSVDSQLAVHVNTTSTFYISGGAFSSNLGTYLIEVYDAGSSARFEKQHQSISAFTNGNGGWNSQDLYARHLADVNGDGIKDIVGFGAGGAQVSLADGTFNAPTSELSAFGPNAGGWNSDNTYHRELADVNGDGRADIVGFGLNGVQVALATGSGHFGAPTAELEAFGVAQGWSSQDLYPRHLADVNGDGKADIVGFGSDGVQVALATGSGHFAAATFQYAEYGMNAGGWSSDNSYHRELADVTGDGKADIVGFGLNDVTVAASHDYFTV